MAATRTTALALLMVLLLAGNASGYDYARAQYTSDGVRVDAQISAGQSWYSPFTENITLVLGVVPEAPGVTQINISEVMVSVHRQELGNSYTLVAVAQSDIDHLAFTGSIANISSQVTLSGSLSGATCYFAVLVAGSYSDGTYNSSFNSVSDEDLVGPFLITPGITSAQSLVGLALMGGFSLLLAAGLYGVRQSRSQTRRHRPLLEE